MDINSLFPSNYLKAADLGGQVRTVTIAGCAPEQLGQGEIKPALQFQGVSKKLILNKTNGMLIAAAYGTETTAWTGRTLELYPEQVMFQGQVVPAIRVRVPAGSAPATAAPADPFANAPPPVPDPAQSPATPPPAQAEQAPQPAQPELPINW